MASKHREVANDRRVSSTFCVLHIQNLRPSLSHSLLKHTEPPIPCDLRLSLSLCGDIPPLKQGKGVATFFNDLELEQRAGRLVGGLERDSATYSPRAVRLE